MRRDLGRQQDSCFAVGRTGAQLHSLLHVAKIAHAKPLDLAPS